MVKHIVLFKFKKTGDIASVKATMREFKSALEALKDKIPFLRFIEVGINENTKEILICALLRNSIRWKIWQIMQYIPTMWQRPKL